MPPRVPPAPKSSPLARRQIDGGRRTLLSVQCWHLTMSLNVGQAVDVVTLALGPPASRGAAVSPLATAPHIPVLVTSGKMAPELGDMPAGARF